MIVPQWGFLIKTSSFSSQKDPTNSKFSFPFEDVSSTFTANRTCSIFFFSYEVKCCFLRRKTVDFQFSGKRQASSTLKQSGSLQHECWDAACLSVDLKSKMKLQSSTQPGWVRWFGEGSSTNLDDDDYDGGYDDNDDGVLRLNNFNECWCKLQKCFTTTQGGGGSLNFHIEIQSA